MIVNLLQRQLERRAELLCMSRNQSLPAELGKSSFEPIEHGVQFILCHYKLDSTRCDYESLVAKIVWEEASKQWRSTPMINKKRRVKLGSLIHFWHVARI